MNARSIIRVGSCILVVVGLGLGFAAIGSPSQNRMRADDARVQQAIYTIASETTVSAAAVALRVQPVYPASLDADLRRAIAFEKRSQNEYALCANFKVAGNEFAQYGTEGPTWAHPAGRHCYRFHYRHLASDGFQTVPLTQ